MKGLIIFLHLLLLTALANGAIIEGRIVQNDEPVEGIRISLYRTLDFDVDPLFISEASDAEGYFQVEVSPGSYALFAKDVRRGLFAFCGRNPVRAETGTIWAGLQTVPLSPVEITHYEDEYTAAIDGVVLFNGKPLADAYVSLYLDAAEDLKGQGYRLSMPTGADGRFAFDGLPESNYYLMARKRSDGNRVGPIREGDYLGHFSSNPVNAKAGSVTRIVIPTVQKVKNQTDSETFLKASGPSISGRVTDPQGNPVAGLHVFAYTDRVIGHKRPAALSTPTGRNGEFNLNLGQPGTYFVGARQQYGDSPAPGELFGMYELTADHGLMVEADQTVKNISIVVEPITLE